MAPLKSIALTLALLWATPAYANPVARWRPYVEEASARFGIPVAWIERVMHAESGGRTTLAGRPIVSHAGAMGLMQLMPRTWAEVRARVGLGYDPHDPRDNILAGAFYLRLMYDRFGYPGLFAAYNAGPGRYAEYLSTKRPLPGETRRYLAQLARSAPRAVRHLPQATESDPERPTGAIFFVLRSVPDETESACRLAIFGEFDLQFVARQPNEECAANGQDHPNAIRPMTLKPEADTVPRFAG